MFMLGFGLSAIQPVLPIDQVLQYATEIADALDRAHRQGLVHRDLKPGNIILAKSGAKLLDFGLAKLASDGRGASALSQMPTLSPSRALTAEGTILGTVQYMAPEQRHFVYTALTGDRNGMYLTSLDGGEPRLLMEREFSHRSSLGYMPGYILFAQDAASFARRFDEDRLQFSGEAVRILDGRPRIGCRPRAICGVLEWRTRERLSGLPSSCNRRDARDP